MIIQGAEAAAQLSLQGPGSMQGGKQKKKNLFVLQFEVPTSLIKLDLLALSFHLASLSRTVGSHR